jgi:hypothetical protein
MQVDALQRTCKASQAALQLLRTDHSEQTSRLAAANAELLQLRSQVSSLQAALQQQQQDVAAALSIMSSRDAAAAAATGCSEVAAAAGAAAVAASWRSRVHQAGNAQGQHSQQQVRRFEVPAFARTLIGLIILGFCLLFDVVVWFGLWCFACVALQLSCPASCVAGRTVWQPAAQ